MRRLLVVLAVLCASLAGPTALADNEPCAGESACQGRQGCAEATAPCSDDDKVTVVVCAQPDSCRFEGQQPASFFPPNPFKIFEYIASAFKLGLDFGRALADIMFVFVENIATLMV